MKPLLNRLANKRKQISRCLWPNMFSLTTYYVNCSLILRVCNNLDVIFFFFLCICCIYFFLVCCQLTWWIKLTNIVPWMDWNQLCVSVNCVVESQECFSAHTEYCCPNVPRGVLALVYHAASTLVVRWRDRHPVCRKLLRKCRLE